MKFYIGLILIILLSNIKANEYRWGTCSNDDVNNRRCAQLCAKHKQIYQDNSFDCRESGVSGISSLWCNCENK